MSNPTFTITVMAGYDGGRIVYESVIDEYGAHDSRLVFGGNADEASKYVAERIAKLEDAPQQQKDEPRQLEAPVKVRMRRPKSELQPVADHLDALEILEGEAD